MLKNFENDTNINPELVAEKKPESALNEARKSEFTEGDIEKFENFKEIARSNAESFMATEEKRLEFEGEKRTAEYMKIANDISAKLLMAGVTFAVMETAAKITLNSLNTLNSTSGIDILQNALITVVTGPLAGQLIGYTLAKVKNFWEWRKAHQKPGNAEPALA